MKRIVLTACIISMCLIGCMPKIVPLKGNYMNKPYETVSDNKTDVVWDKIIDFFAQNGLSIRIIDRSSGLIISNESKLPYTYENSKTHQVNNKKAWVVIPKVTINGQIIDPSSVAGEWNVRIKPLPENKTNINVNLVNIVGYTTPASGMYGRTQPTQKTSLDAKSTGVFEQLIADIIR